MKVYYLIIGIVLSLFLFSCSHTTKTSEGYLTINNTTDGYASVSIGNGNPFTIQANSSKTITVNTDHSTHISLSYTGEYIDSGNDTIGVNTNQTSTYDLYADCASLRIYNNSSNTLYITFPNKASNSIDSFSYSSFKIFLGNNTSANAGFDYTGLYVFSGHNDISVYSDETTNTTINADTGAININNNSSYDLYHIYLSPSSQSYWGADALNNNLNNGDSVIWTVAQGHWDIKVVDSYGDAFYIYDSFVVTNETLSVNYYDRKSADWQKTDQKLMGNGDFRPALQFTIVNK